MAKANSITTLIRRKLAKLIEPTPNHGEAWCMDCSLMSGTTLTISDNNITNHIRLHKPGEPLHIKVYKPSDALNIRGVKSLIRKDHD